MSVMNHDDEPRTGGMGTVLVIGGGILALLIVGVVAYTMLAPAPPTPKEEPAPPKVETPKPAPKPVAKEPEPAKPVGPKPRKEKPVEVVPPPPPPPAGPALVVESDVAGASVFVDRKYLGTTPLRTTEVTPGAHQLNASATGEDGVAQSIDIAATGDTAVSIRFHEVRLNASVAVVHKHGIGSCEGRLAATPAGISYETASKKDAFVFPLKDLEVFEIDYMKKELKVKQRGGKTWNFTDKSENADKLFVFHRDVTKAREKMAAQFR
jgi:hypothetical protein